MYMRVASDPNQVSMRGIRAISMAVVASVCCALGIAQQTPAPVAQNPNPAAQVQSDSPATAPNLSPQEVLDRQRKDQLAADTALLLKLANELKTEMDKSSKDELSLAVIKKADQVEKLAHKVRDEMKITIGY
jgi:hypothetical protein